MIVRGRVIGFGAAILTAVAVLLFAPHSLSGIVRDIAAYDAGAIVLLVAIYSLTMSSVPERTRTRAGTEDPGRIIVFFAILISCVIALGSALLVLPKPHTFVHVWETQFVMILGVIAVGCAWTLIHTAMSLRYAHLFYYDDGDGTGIGGLEFPKTPHPNDYDFMYFSFIVGMTFQVSDVVVTDTGFRRHVLYHSILSFAFNTAIIALGVNIVSGLVH
jgi:uncharacterized membrane protein